MHGQSNCDNMTFSRDSVDSISGMNNLEHSSGDLAEEFEMSLEYVNSVMANQSTILSRVDSECSSQILKKPREELAAHFGLSPQNVNNARNNVTADQNTVSSRVESEPVSHPCSDAYLEQSEKRVVPTNFAVSPQNENNVMADQNTVFPNVGSESVSQPWVSIEPRQGAAANSEVSSMQHLDKVTSDQKAVLPNVNSDNVPQTWVNNNPNQSAQQVAANFEISSIHQHVGSSMPDQNAILSRVKNEFMPRTWVDSNPNQPRQEVISNFGSPSMQYANNMSYQNASLLHVKNELTTHSWADNNQNQPRSETISSFGSPSMQHPNNVMPYQNAVSSSVGNDYQTHSWGGNFYGPSETGSANVFSTEKTRAFREFETVQHQMVKQWNPFPVGGANDGFGFAADQVYSRPCSRQVEQQVPSNSWNQAWNQPNSIGYGHNQSQNMQVHQVYNPTPYNQNNSLYANGQNRYLTPSNHQMSLENQQENATTLADHSHRDQLTGKDGKPRQKLSLKMQYDIVCEIEAMKERKSIAQKYNLTRGNLDQLIRTKDVIKYRYLDELKENDPEAFHQSRELSLHEKVGIIRRVERDGVSIFNVAKEYNVLPQRVMEIWDNNENVRRAASRFSNHQTNNWETLQQTSSSSSKENVPAGDDMGCSSGEERLEICEYSTGCAPVDQIYLEKILTQGLPEHHAVYSDNLVPDRNRTPNFMRIRRKPSKSYVRLNSLSLEEKYGIIWEIEEKKELQFHVAMKYDIWPSAVRRIMNRKDEIIFGIFQKYQFKPGTETVEQWLKFLSNKRFLDVDDPRRDEAPPNIIGYDYGRPVMSSAEETLAVRPEVDVSSRRLTVEEEFGIIREVEERGKSHFAVAEEYNISVPRVSYILLSKDVIKSKVAQNLDLQQGYNEKVLQWLDRMPEARPEERFDGEAPKLKGRPRRKRKKRSVSPAGESSNESEASVASSAAASTSKGSSSSSICGKGNDKTAKEAVTNSVDSPTGAKRTERKPSAEEKKFVSDLHSFMSLRNTPLGKMPSLGCRQIDLYLFYSKVQDLGGYDKVSSNRLWKSVYDEMGGNTNSTSAATITRKHYEKLLLPYEKSLKGEEEKVKPDQPDQCTKTPNFSDASEDSMEVKREVESPPPSKTPPPPSDASSRSTPPLMIVTSPFSSSRSDSSKTSSLRSVRVKSERLKSLSSIIATGGSSPTATPVQQSAVQTPGSPSSAIATMASSPTTMTASSPTPASGSSSVIEKQVSSPLVTQQMPTSCSPPVSSAATNVATVVTLTPPPEKDMKEIKLDPKQTNLLAQGKENIPLFEAKSPSLFSAEKPHSPEVIDLETESESGVIKDKLIIPSFKKRKLEILREGGLEVTPVDCDRASVIQPPTSTVSTAASTMTSSSISSPSLSTTTTATTTTSPTSQTPSNSGPAIVTATITPRVKLEGSPSPPPPTTVIPKLINVTVTPDNGSRSSINVKPEQQQSSPNSKVINLGTANNANLLQLYANANMPVPQQTARGFAPPGIARSPISKVTQSRSMYGNSGKMVYGNPKDIIAVPKFMPAPLPRPLSPRSQSIVPGPPTGLCAPNVESPTPGGVLDLTAKPSSHDRPSSARPSLEIVKVPQVRRPSPISLEMHQGVPKSQLDQIAPRNDQYPQIGLSLSQPGYPHLLDNRTVTANNLEISLVNNPVKRPTAVGPPQLSPSNRFNNTVSPAQPSLRRIAPAPPHQQHQQHMNGKYSSRLPSEPISPYTPRKAPSSSNNNISSGGGIQHPVIPNVPNLNHLNANNFGKVPVTSYQQFPMEKRKAPSHDSIREQQRRITESDKLAAQQHQRMLEANAIVKQAREAEAASRRQSLPSLPSGFLPGLPPGANSAYLAHQLAAASGNNPAMAAAAAAAAAGKFLPMMDPALYYSSLYNGMFPGPMPPSAAAPQFMTPDMNAFYNELVLSQQARLAMQQQQQQPPSSK